MSRRGGSIVRDLSARPLEVGGATLRGQAPRHRRDRGPGGDARRRLPRAPGELVADPLQRPDPVARLRPALGRDPHDPARPVADPHAREGLVLLLPARSRRAVGGDVAVAGDALELAGAGLHGYSSCLLKRRVLNQKNTAANPTSASAWGHSASRPTPLSTIARMISRK